MPAPENRIRDLIRVPREALSIEVKDWLDPRDKRDAAKIVKACLALRNQNGGFLVIGVDDRTLEPSTREPPGELRELYHSDEIQSLVSAYSSERFEVHVHFAERDGQTHPVIEVDGGTKSPVAATRRLEHDGRTLIRKDAVYVRSLESNNTVSSSEARARDWPRIAEICFENREADIGRFFRRHLVGASPETLGGLRDLLGDLSRAMPSDEQSASDLLERGKGRFEHERLRRKLVLPRFGTFEVACTVTGDVPERSSNQSFLSELMASNPSLTGWPAWTDSRPFADRSTHPYVFENAWEAFIWSEGRDWFHASIDFWRLEPRGEFYALRAFQDDLQTAREIEPLSVLDFGLPILRLAEAIIVAKGFAKAIGCVPDSTELVFAFRWQGLQGRRLSSWANPNRELPGVDSTAVQDEVQSAVRVPLDTPDSAVGSVVRAAVEPLFAAFQGFEVSIYLVEDLTRRLIERQM